MKIKRISPASLIILFISILAFFYWYLRDAYKFQYQPPPPKEVLTAISGQEYWTQLKEGQKAGEYYRIDNEIYCGGAGCGSKSLQNIDINSFTVAGKASIH